jgi:Putative DNA-binding domain
MDVDSRLGRVSPSDLGKQLLEQIISTYIKLENLETVAHCNLTNSYSILSSLDIDNLKSISLDDKNHASKYDLLIGDFPIGAKSSGKLNLNIKKTLESLSLIGEKGHGIYVFEGFGSVFVKQKLHELLNGSGFYVNAVVSLPRYTIPFTAIKAILVFLSKKNNDTTFFCEVESVETVDQTLENLVKNHNTNILNLGVSENIDKFKGFESWHIEKEINALKTDYSNYQKFKLIDLIKDVKLPRQGSTLEQSENTVYIPKIGTQNATTDVNTLNLKSHNVFVVEVNRNKIDPAYLCNYLNSTLGKLIISQSKDEKNFIPSMNKSDLLDLDIALPDLTVQKQIANTINKLETIKSIILSFETNLSLSPINSQSTLDQIDKVMEIVSELNDADKVKSLIRKGETDTIEFKGTFTLCLKENQKKTDLALQCIKTIAAFLNSRGGFLLIGVADNGEITGIDLEVEMFHKNSDKFMLSFMDQLKYKIGEQFFPYIKQRLVAINGKHVVLVECLPSTKAVFVEEKDFYVRTNPATHRLEGQKQASYIENRFYVARWQL